MEWYSKSDYCKTISVVKRRRCYVCFNVNTCSFKGSSFNVKIKKLTVERAVLRTAPLSEQVKLFFPGFLNLYPYFHYMNPRMC